METVMKKAQPASFRKTISENEFLKTTLILVRYVYNIYTMQIFLKG